MPRACLENRAPVKAHDPSTPVWYVTNWLLVRLFPREEKFFDLLEEQGVHIVEASRLLHDGVRTNAAAMATMAGEIKRIEHAADKVTHQLFTRLNQTFVTPLDPEDLHNLGSALDDVVDYIEDAAFRLSAYRVHPVPKGVPELTEIIYACCLKTTIRCRQAEDQPEPHGRLYRNQPAGKCG